MTLLISLGGTILGILFSSIAFILGLIGDIVIWFYRVGYTIKELFK